MDREQVGTRASILGIIVNIALAVLNLTIGIIGNSSALIAAGGDNISDVLASAITAIFFKIGLKAANEDYPYGYGRAEPIAGLIIAGFLAVVGYEILLESWTKLSAMLFLHQYSSPDLYTAVMALIAFGVNFFIATYLLRTGKKINSSAIIAIGKHKFVDIFSSLAVFFGILISIFGFPIADPILGIVVCVLIFKTSIEIGFDNSKNILGHVPEGLYDYIYKRANRIEGVEKVQELKINVAGAYTYLEIEIIAKDDSYDLEQKIEKELLKIEYVKGCSVQAIPQE
jgi:cation diffusion facilitator family transporter